MILNASDIVNKAIEFGFDKCGIIPVGMMSEYEDRLEERMEHFPQTKEKYETFKSFAHLQEDYPWAKAIVICSFWYGRYHIPDELQGCIAKYYLTDGRRNTESKGYQTSVAFEKYLTDCGFQVATDRDFGITALRWAAMKAGIGIIRKNNFFYTEKGSYQYLEAFLIDVPLQYIAESHIRPCAEKCNLCMKACPTGSLEAPYMMCRNTCVSCLTTWDGWDLKSEPLQNRFGKWIYGCDSCQDACPHNKNAWKDEEEFPGLNEWGSYFSYSNIVLSDYSWLKSVIQPKLWYIPSGKEWRYKVNALNAMLNNYDPDYLPVIKEACNDEYAEVRDMAKWVLEKIQKTPDKIKIRGGRVHNLKNIDVDVPLHKIVGIAGVSGSGKSSLALGILYAEGSRRYLESLSTYTRRRMTQAEKAQVDEVLYVPAALALRQRPGVPGIRSTFGTGTELLNSLRLMFSRLASHRCPNGHYVEPSLNVAAGLELVCPVCGVHFFAPGAEELAFNSQGACKRCDGTGIARTVDEATLVPDDSLSIDEGAVAPWQTLMWSLMKDIAREMGVRTDVPFRELTDKERDIVFHGPAVKKNIIYQNKTSGAAGDMDFTYFNATYTVENALAKVKDEKGMKRVEKFLRQDVCPDCGGTRLSESARAPKLRGISLAQACAMTLSDLIAWVDGVPDSLPGEMRPMARSICESFQTAAKRLMDLGLSYLTLDRAASTLSTGERQRMQLARAVRNRTTGVLYVLDEPSIGLHPSNMEGLTGVMNDLLADGNTVILVDHDTNVLKEADWLIELGPEAGAGGGTIIAQGPLETVANSPDSRIGGFLTGKTVIDVGTHIPAKQMFDLGAIHISTSEIHTVKPLEVDFPKGRLIAVTGVSGSGKTTMVLESLIPALEASIKGSKLPGHVKSISAGGISQVKLIDATPIGINVRSTVATYADVHDELRKVFARTPDAKERGYRAGDFSYNTGTLRCPTCDGTGVISLDVQFLPDVEIPCPDCGGSRYSRDAGLIRRVPKKGGQANTLPELMDMSIDEALAVCADLPLVARRLQVLHDLGLGYLTLGEETPSLSGGEAQRLKLASEIGKGQSDSVFVFDEPTIGLHPLDVRTLLGVFQRLIENGATVIVIEHDLDVIKNADYVIDMGPGGGVQGGQIIAKGTPEEICRNKNSLTGKYLKQYCLSVEERVLL